MKLTKKFLIDFKNPKNRTGFHTRINNDLLAYAHADAEQKGMKFVDWMNLLILSKVTIEESGKDLFSCLNK